MRIYPAYDFEHYSDFETKKSVLLVRQKSLDINPDRAVTRHFIAYDVPCPHGDEPIEAKPFELKGEFGAPLACEMLLEYINQSAAKWESYAS